MPPGPAPNPADFPTAPGCQGGFTRNTDGTVTFNTPEYGKGSWWPNSCKSVTVDAATAAKKTDAYFAKASRTFVDMINQYNAMTTGYGKLEYAAYGLPSYFMNTMRGLASGGAVFTGSYTNWVQGYLAGNPAQDCAYAPGDPPPAACSNPLP